MNLGLGLRSRWHHWRFRLMRWRFSQRAPLPYAPSYRYENVACLVVKNEAAILEEWILFHLSIGMDHIVVIDNNSSDHSRQLLEPYSKAGLISWREMPVEPFSAWEQIKAYNQLIADFRGVSRWLWFLDSDEFLVPSADHSIRSLTKALAGNPRHGAIAVNWLFFGTAGVEKLAPGEWHIERLNRRAPKDWPRHRVVKCGLRPEAAAGYFESPHLPYLFRHRSLVYADGQPYDGQRIDHSLLKVHHYWHRTEDFFERIKIPRRELLVGTSYGPQGRKLHHDKHNELEDKGMQGFLPAMRNLQARIRSK